jgi:hypothetical protein
MDLSKLTPAPWTVDERGWCDDADYHENQEGIALMRNAADVMMRRGWWPVCDSEKWFVRGEGTGPLQIKNDDGPWSDPFTALVEADRWYKENVEAKP